MRKAILCIFAYIFIALSYKVAIAGETSNIAEETRIANHIQAVYRQVDFGKYAKVSFEAFDKAYRGYLNLRNAGKLSLDKDIISICDFTLSSNDNRLWIIDLRKKKVLFNTFVAHGSGSGEEFATAFSNRENSHQSSLGFYVTADTYEGEHGTSLHLAGMDNGYNDAAWERAIVMHAADYVSDKFIAGNERLGRSWGCPAVKPELAMPIINTIKDGTCLFIYYPDTRYLASSYWMNKKVASLPDYDPIAMGGDFLVQDPSKPAGRKIVRIIQYEHNGKIDSTKTIYAD